MKSLWGVSIRLDVLICLGHWSEPDAGAIRLCDAEPGRIEQRGFESHLIQRRHHSRVSPPLVYHLWRVDFVNSERVPLVLQYTPLPGLPDQQLFRSHFIFHCDKFACSYYSEHCKLSYRIKNQIAENVVHAMLNLISVFFWGGMPPDPHRGSEVRASRCPFARLGDSPSKCLCTSLLLNLFRTIHFCFIASLLFIPLFAMSSIDL